MPKITVNLTEQLSDARSNEVAYRATVENTGVEPVHLLALTPRLPEGVELIEVKDFSAELDKVRHQRLCKELSSLLNNHLSLISADYRKEISIILKDYVKEAFSTIGILYVIARISSAGNGINTLAEKYYFMDFSIKNHIDAKAAISKWFTDSSGIVGEIFLAKAEQLERLEKTMGAGEISKALAVIETDSFAATTYVLRFPRSHLNPRKFSFTVEASVSFGQDKPVQLHAASTTVTVSPRPYVLSIITVLSAFMGASLKYSLTATPSQSIQTYFSSLMTYLFTSPGLSGAALALIVFNVYEYMELGRTIKMGIGWRSALLVGALCGLFSDRMIKALQVLVGG
ncbi:hypothetical protein NKI89_10235 [Mesorhizobium sp. M0309]|uniref:hypothetical protein n=1 Tax=Mesorhizobium sp. M0309 TaxID=2956933 RepID=UPI003334C536